MIHVDGLHRMIDQFAQDSGRAGTTGQRAQMEWQPRHFEQLSSSLTRGNDSWTISFSLLYRRYDLTSLAWPLTVGDHRNHRTTEVQPNGRCRPERCSPDG